MLAVAFLLLTETIRDVFIELVGEPASWTFRLRPGRPTRRTGQRSRQHRLGYGGKPAPGGYSVRTRHVISEAL